MLHAEGANNLAVFVGQRLCCELRYIASTLGIACRSNESPLTGERVTRGRRETFLFRRGDSAIEIHAWVPKEEERENERASERERKRERSLSTPVFAAVSGERWIQ